MRNLQTIPQDIFVNGFLCSENSLNWNQLPQFSECCKHLLPIAAKLSELPPFLERLLIPNFPNSSPLKFSLNSKRYELIIQNRLTEKTSFALLHFFAHLQGKALNEFYYSDYKNAINPWFFNALHE